MLTTRDIIALIVLFSGIICVTLMCWTQFCLSFKLSRWKKCLLLILLFAPCAGLFAYRLLGFRASYCHKVFTFTFLVWLLWFAMYAFAADFASYLWNAWYRHRRRSVAWRKATCLALIALIPTTIVSLWQPYAMRIKTIEIQDSRIPPEADGYKIMHITDTHLGTLTSDKIVDIIQETYDDVQPDLLLHTGDLIDSHDIPRIEAQFQKLAMINPPDGKFAIRGNHDIMGGDDLFLQAAQASGFGILGNDNLVVLPRPWLMLLGLDFREMPLLDVPALKASNRAGEAFSILLYHLPEPPAGVIPDINQFQLYLAGHTHGGQIFPFSLAVNLLNRYKTGKYYPGSSDTADSCRLYISPGTGYWGPPMRFLVRPEIVVFVLKSAPSP